MEAHTRKWVKTQLLENVCGFRKGRKEKPLAIKRDPFYFNVWRRKKASSRNAVVQEGASVCLIGCLIKG